MLILIELKKCLSINLFIFLWRNTTNVIEIFSFIYTKQSATLSITQRFIYFKIVSAYSMTKTILHFNCYHCYSLDGAQLQYYVIVFTAIHQMSLRRFQTIHQMAHKAFPAAHCALHKRTALLAVQSLLPDAATSCLVEMKWNVMNGVLGHICAHIG